MAHQGSRVEHAWRCIQSDGGPNESVDMGFKNTSLDSSLDTYKLDGILPDFCYPLDNLPRGWYVHAWVPPQLKA